MSDRSTNPSTDVEFQILARSLEEGGAHKILVNDHAGHPFQVQLSRWLARQGHEVLHTYSSSVQTPRGALKRQPTDSDRFAVQGISIGCEFKKYGLLSRWRQERLLGDALVARAADFQPDAIISANTPIGAQRKLADYARKERRPFIFWLQDVLGFGMRRALRAKLPGIGDLIGYYFERFEQRIWRDSDHVVAITEDFVPVVERAGVAGSRVTTIRNWAPLDEIPLKNRDNDWSRRYGLNDKFSFLYSGTLGLKHNPELIVALAEAFRAREDVRIVVNSEGLGAEFLRKQKGARGLDNLLLLGFQPFRQMPEVLASGDVLVALLEPDAGQFAVPSKVLTYLCARRPLLLAVPPANLAARIVQEAKVGQVVPPGGAGAFVVAARQLMEDEQTRLAMAENARAYAETAFDINRIGRRFELIIESCIQQKKPRRNNEEGTRLRGGRIHRGSHGQAAQGRRVLVAGRRSEIPPIR